MTEQRKAAIPTSGDGGTQLDAYLTTGGSPPMHRGRRNFKKEHPQAYELWRLQMRYSQSEFWDLVTPEAYIAAVACDWWEQRNVNVLLAYPYRSNEYDDGLPSTVTGLRDTVMLVAKDANSIESRMAELDETVPVQHGIGTAGASGDGHGGVTADRATGAERLRVRPLWGVERFTTGWRWTVEDPADAWVTAIDRRAKKVACLAAALTLPKRKRLAMVDRLLDAFSTDGDADFMEALFDWVCEQVPGYAEHCVQQVANVHKRGRKPHAKMVA